MIIARGPQARLEQIELLGLGIEDFRRALLVAAGNQEAAVRKHGCRVARAGVVEPGAIRK